ncbi:ABC transporter permease subunit [Natronorubrum sp. JWXQ-INN-674]|uniref:ABC transporter permease subunit n=1 Tax=Natronorubrum halalkaliphilum TaxID=2691917 RepID=A0A6B0VIV3_9EURY|nr:ABC transporter permease [Natronorubrum halalkaliphilum]MXV60529.1 ABC transporter permease subunit [Natronorubrum halalkaliphilum]
MATPPETAEMGDQPVSSSAGEADESIRDLTGWRYTLAQIKRDRTARLGWYIISVVSVVAIVTYVDSQLLNYYIADTFWYHPERDAEGTALLPPVGLENSYGAGTWSHPLGTDQRGRDLLVRIVYGTRIAIQVGVVATGLGVIVGTIIGAVSGYYGGWIDDILQRTVETVYAIPFLILVIAIMSAFGRHLWIAIVGVGIVTVPIFARLIRSEVLKVREEEYIEAAKAIGVKDRHILARHIIPNSFAPVLVQGTLQIGVNILIVAGLSFLGFGVQPPTPSWGQILADSRGYMLPNPWFSIFPGIAILVTVMGFNLLGDGLRDALDPRNNG